MWQTVAVATCDRFRHSHATRYWFVPLWRLLSNLRKPLARS
jgi:hypothetical protein